MVRATSRFLTVRDRNWDHIGRICPWYQQTWRNHNRTSIDNWNIAHIIYACHYGNSIQPTYHLKVRTKFFELDKIGANLIILRRSKLSLSRVSSALKTACRPFPSAPKLSSFDKQSSAFTPHFFLVAESTSRKILQQPETASSWENRKKETN